MARFRFAGLSLVMLCTARLAAGADGSLDPGFGTGGKVTSGFAECLALAVYPDGRLIVGGGSHGFSLARFHSDGTPDTTFADDGALSTTGDGERAVTDIVVLDDERIIAVGYAQDGFDYFMRLIRYHPDGTLDASYGTAGKVTVGFPGGAVSGNAVLQPDGKLLNVAIVRYSGGLTYSIALARFDPDGSLDASFGSGGQTVTDLPDMGEYATDVVLAPDGKFYVVGVAATPSGQGGYGQTWLIVRHNPDGSMDAAYGDGGRVIESLYSGYAKYERAVGAALQPDGKLVVGGDSGGSFALARFNSDGTLDQMFGTWGKVVVRSFPDVEAAGFVRRPDGKLLLAGTSNRGPEGTFAPRSFAIMAFAADGHVDASFAPCPQVSTSFGADVSQARTIALQPDGKAVVAGGLESGGLVMARYGTPATPACQPAASRRSSLVIKDHGNAERDSLKWKWRGQPVAFGALGDPTADAGYTLCVVDQPPSGPALRLGSPMMRSGWSAFTSGTGYAFKASSENAFPFSRAQLKATASGRGTFKIDAKGGARRAPPAAGRGAGARGARRDPGGWRRRSGASAGR